MRSLERVSAGKEALELSRKCFARFNERRQETLRSLERASMANEDLISRGWMALVDVNAVKVGCFFPGGSRLAA